MKAQIYSIIAALIAVPLLLFIVYYGASSQTTKSGVTEKIVADQIQQVEESIENDFLRAVQISGRRALLSATDVIITNGNFLNNANLGIKELVENATLLGNSSYVMINNTLSDWRNKITAIDVGFNKNMVYSNLAIRDYSSFNLLFDITLEVNVSDRLGLSRIDKAMSKSSLVSVTGLEDPLIPLHTQGYVRGLIRQYTFPYYAKKIATGSASSGNCTGFVTFDPNEANKSQKILVIDDAAGISGFTGVVGQQSNLPGDSCYVVGAANAIDLINSTIIQSNYSIIYLDNKTDSAWSLPIEQGILNGYYYPEPGPSFLERLQGNLTESSDGLESFVIIPNLQKYGIPVKTDQSVVDYLYFSQINYIGKIVRGLPGWFRIDQGHAGRYNLTELLES